MSGFGLVGSAWRRLRGARNALVGVSLALVLRPAPTAAQPRSESGLVDAFMRTDFDGIARAGRAYSARGLAKLLRGGPPSARRAAIAAAPAAEDAWQLLGDLAVLAGNADRAIAPAAARAAALICQSLSPTRIAELEITEATLRERAARWGALARHNGVWPDVRVHALEINALLTRALSAEARDGIAVKLEAIAGDPEPEVRRAAIELADQPLDASNRERGAEMLRSDGDPVIAVVAGQALCGGIAMGDAPRPILAAIGAKGLERLRDLVGNPKLPITARIDAAYCLRAKGGKLDRAALARLAKSAPSYARAEVNAVTRGRR